VELFKTIKNALFLSSCSTHVVQVLPSSSNYASEFSHTISPFLLAFKDKGFKYADAVNATCVLILENTATFIEGPNGEARVRALAIASNYCMNFIQRWPGAESERAMATALAIYIESVKQHPLVKSMSPASSQP
jgi:hypothetical protein